MNLSAGLRSRISALGELSRPLGEARAAVLARKLVQDVARDVSRGRDPESTIDAWVQRLAIEIVEKAPRPAADDAKTHKPKTQRRLADLLPEVST